MTREACQGPQLPPSGKEAVFESGEVVGLSDKCHALWAIVTTGGSCGAHAGPCPMGVRGPYWSLVEAHEAAKGVVGKSNPHVVPYWTHSNRSSDTSPGSESGRSGS
jgi:hypothetical protein